MIAEQLRAPDLLGRVATAIHEQLGYDRVAIPLLDDRDAGVLVLRARAGGGAPASQEYRIPVARGIMGAAVREGRTVRVNDVEVDARYMPSPGGVGMRAELAVPIRSGERVLGVVDVESRSAITDEDEAGIEVLADQLGVALENVRLYERDRRLAVLEERQRLARVLHDSVTQHIFGMALIGESLVPAWQRDATEGERRAQRLVDLARAALLEMRQLLDELRPEDAAGETTGSEPRGLARLRRFGLVSALEQQTADLARTELRVELDATRYVPRDLRIEEGLFRIAQEALGNVVRHAGARQVLIRLVTKGGETRLEVADDGVGFGRDGRSGGGGFGISSMREQASELGGRLKVESAPGRGTRIEARIPDEGGVER